MKIISWNVAGFRKSNSTNVWDYSAKDIQYFANEINKLMPDVVMLQEVEFNNNEDSLKDFAEKINIENFQGFPMHENHIAKNSKLGYAVLSKKEIINIERVMQPYPTFQLKFSDGREAVQYDKEFIKFMTYNKTFITFQLQPLHYWGYNYYEEPGISYAKTLEKDLLSISSEIITGDFQFSHLQIPFPQIYNNFIEALPEEFTRIRENGKNTKSDHILLNKDLKILDSQIVNTKTDHFLCYCEVQ